MPAVPVRDRFPIRLLHPRQSDERGEHREVTRDRVMKTGEETVDRANRISGMDEETRESLPSPHTIGCPCGLEGAHDGGPDRNDAMALVARSVHKVRRRIR